MISSRSSSLSPSTFPVSRPGAPQAGEQSKRRKSESGATRRSSVTAQSVQPTDALDQRHLEVTQTLPRSGMARAEYEAFRQEWQSYMRDCHREHLDTGALWLQRALPQVLSLDEGDIRNVAKQLCAHARAPEAFAILDTWALREQEDDMPLSFNCVAQLYLCAYAAADSESALLWAEELVAMTELNHASLARALILNDRPREAMIQLASVERQDRGLEFWSTCALALKACGVGTGITATEAASVISTNADLGRLATGMHPQDAQNHLLQEILRRTGEGHMSRLVDDQGSGFVHRAIVLAAMDRYEEAFDSLDEAIAMELGDRAERLLCPALRELHLQPQWPEFCERAGIPRAQIDPHSDRFPAELRAALGI